MKYNVSIVPFRVVLVHGTAALTPLSVPLPAVASSLLELVMFSNAVPDATKTGWRMKNKGEIIIPSGLGADGGFTPGDNEAGWMALPFTKFKMDLHDLTIPDVSNLTLEFYNSGPSGDFTIAGFLLSRDPVHGPEDVYLEMLNQRAAFNKLISRITDPK